MQEDGSGRVARGVGLFHSATCPNPFRLESMISTTATTNMLEPQDGESYYDKFFVYNAADVRRHLQRLVDGHCTLVAHADGAYEGVVTLLLQVEDSSLWIDIPRGQDTLTRWLDSAELRFEGSIERVALRFACGPAVLDQHDGRPALLLPMPDRVLHLQRREFVRREPAAGSVVCKLHAPEGAKSAWIDAAVRDIGGGGVALILTPEQKLRPVVGDLLAGCRIDLPQFGDIEFDLRVRHVIEREHRGRTILQAGCEFAELAPAAQRKLFRYLMQLDREELARRRQYE
jgi:c-di-GMP-binding flagellar brake protein YcgR